MEGSFAIVYKAYHVIFLIYNPVSVPLDLHPNELKFCHQNTLCTNIYRSFIHNCKNVGSKMPSAGEGLSKQYANTLQYYSELKRNELSSHENT